VWYRIFGASEAPPDLEAMLAFLRGADFVVEGEFHGDEQDWFQAVLVSPETHEPIELARFLASEEGIRDELNAWAAWIEANGDSSTHLQLMQQIISTRQLITLLAPDDPQHHVALDLLCTAASQFLARETAGIYQIDEQGLYAPNGILLVREA
jgi:hypothetical protein